MTAGVWYRCLDVDLVKPEDYDLTFSFELGKTLRQPWFSYEGSAKRWDRPDVWYLLPDGSNLVESVRDAAAVLVASGLPPDGPIRGAGAGLSCAADPDLPQP